MSASSRAPEGALVQTVVGTTLTFLGVVLITLGTDSAGTNGVVLAGAIAVTLAGLGLLLHVILQHTPRDQRP